MYGNLLKDAQETNTHPTVMNYLILSIFQIDGNSHSLTKLGHVCKHM